MSSTGWLGGIYTPNLCYIVTVIPLPTQNIPRIFWAGGLFTGWNVQFVYSIRFVIGTLPRRSYLTFGVAQNLRGLPRTFGRPLVLETFGSSFGWPEPSVGLANLRACLSISGVLHYLELFGSPSACHCFAVPSSVVVMIPNSSPSRARADSDGPIPRSIHHLRTRKTSPSVGGWDEPKVIFEYVSSFYWMTLGILLELTISGTVYFYLTI